MKILLPVITTLLVLVPGVIGCAPSAVPEAASPEAEVAPAPGLKTYSAPPSMMIDTNKEYIATIETEKGDIVLELFASDVPTTVNNFVFLAHEGFYNGTTFHRVIPGFMVQGGDPTGTGRGNPGYTFADEFTGHTHVAGALSMANSGPNTNGCQFFITYTPQHGLDGKHSVFGQVIEGFDVLQSLTPRDPSRNPDFIGDRVIRITIEER